MSYLIDTDWIIDYLNGSQRAPDLFSSLVESNLGISLVTFGEVNEGIKYGRDPTLSEAACRLLLRVIHAIDLDQDVMHRFARIRDDLRGRGWLIGDSDLMIAATTMHHGLILVTRNLNDFRRVPGLTLHEPT